MYPAPNTGCGYALSLLEHTDSTGCVEVPLLAHGAMTMVNDGEECEC